MSVRGGEGAGEGEEASDSDALPTSAGGGRKQSGWRGFRHRQSATGSAAAGSPEQRSRPGGEEACGGRDALVLGPGHALSPSGGWPRPCDLDTVTRADLKVEDWRNCHLCSRVPSTLGGGIPPHFACVWGAPLTAPVSCPS